jgi:hypothetical protein
MHAAAPGGSLSHAVTAVSPMLQYMLRCASFELPNWEQPDARVAVCCQVVLCGLHPSVVHSMLVHCLRMLQEVIITMMVCAGCMR